jgi:transglutaminase-like putative cysteine protease/uncharacterized alpha-E superfamily protein
MGQTADKEATRMLLARMAQAVYWAGRYLERAQDMARVVLVHGDTHADLPVGEDVGWAPLLSIVGADQSWSRPITEAEIVDYLLIDAGNPASVLAALHAVRDNFRVARVVVPREAWQLGNDLWRAQGNQRLVVQSRDGRVPWLRQVVSVCQRLNGALWGTMRRDEALAFARIGEGLERADFTCRVLRARAECAAPARPDDPYAEVRAMAVLRALDAYQAFRRFMPTRLDPGSVAAFVLHDEAFPRAVASCLSEVRDEVKRLPHNEGVLAACTEASIRLSDASPTGMDANELRVLTTDMMETFATIHHALAATYFDVAVPSTTVHDASHSATLSRPATRFGDGERHSDEARCFRITHTTTYQYEGPAEHSFNEAHLRPRQTASQRCFAHQLAVEPTPVTWSSFVDLFGNTVTTFTVDGPFDVLSVTARSEVQVSPVPAPRTSPPWESARAMLERDRRPEASEARYFRASSRLVPSTPAFAEYAEQSFVGRRPVVDAVVDLCHRIHADFSYEPGFTSITTPLLEVFEERRGVCQDFAHLFVGLLRAVGLAGRYVSGYIEGTAPSDGSPVQGASASHAWASVFLPGWGWLDIDPTNDQLVADSHVTVAWGRDYWDVSPLRGSVEGGGTSHSLDVAVEVRRIVPGT